MPSEGPAKGSAGVREGPGAPWLCGRAPQSAPLLAACMAATRADLRGAAAAAPAEKLAHVAYAEEVA